MTKNEELISNINKKITKKLVYELKPIGITMLSDKLVRVDSLFAGLDGNRNGTYISKETMDEALLGLPYIPVVAHIYTENGKRRIGSHDIEIDIRGDMIEIEPSTEVVGVVTETPFSYVNVEEEPGQFREYVKGELILWSHMTPILEAAYNANDMFNISMEIEVHDSFRGQDGLEHITKFEFLKLCLLNRDHTNYENNIEPAFKEAVVTSKSYLADYSLKIKEDTDKIKQEILKFNLENNNVEKEEVKLDNEMIFAKLLVSLGEMKYSTNSKSYDKYIYITHNDNAVYALDRTDGYKAFSIPYVATDVNGEIITSINYEEKKEVYFDISDESKFSFSIQNEVDLMSKDMSAYDLANKVSEENLKLSDELKGIKVLYEVAQSDVARMKSQLEIFEKEKKDILYNQHRQNIDNMIEGFSFMRGFDEYSRYKVEIDYSKSSDTIANELKGIHYNYLKSTTDTEYSTSNNDAGIISVQSTSPAHTYSLAAANGKLGAIEKEYGSKIAALLRSKI